MEPMTTIFFVFVYEDIKATIYVFAAMKMVKLPSSEAEYFE